LSEYYTLKEMQVHARDAVRRIAVADAVLTSAV
jgi:hypothetical protein